MDYPEYLSLFSNQGDYQVQVRFKDNDGCVARQAMMADEITNLVDPRTGAFYGKMYLDDHLFEINKYEIDPTKMTLLIKARRAE